MTVNYCGLNGQHSVMPLMCGHNTPTYKNNTIFAIITFDNILTNNYKNKKVFTIFESVRYRVLF